MHSAINTAAVSPLVHFNTINHDLSYISPAMVADAVALVRYLEATWRINLNDITQDFMATYPWLGDVEEIVTRHGAQVANTDKPELIDKAMVRMLLAGVLIGRGSR